MVGSDNSWTIPEDDFQGVESTRGHQASAFFRYFHYLVVLVHRNRPPQLVGHNITQVLNF